nr:UDP-N-acetylglucosamine 2-epimerase (hydrolyzing) [Chitinophagaceae bacterium]
DYGIYRPLLQLLQKDADIKLQLVAFGTHTSPAFGHTIDAILSDGFEITRTLPFVLDGQSPATVATSMARTLEQFANVWKELETDLIICLGDRYEMFAAVAAAIPFSIPVAHIHGGETTMGAMDNVFRHSLTHMSTLHFAGCEQYRQRIIDLTGNKENVFNTGALSIDNLSSLQLLNKDEFLTQFGVDLNKPTLLTTFHPETISFEKNETYARELCTALDKLTSQFQVLITMPNADTMGTVVRQQFEILSKNNPAIFAFENLGILGYLSAMEHCAMLLGNTSSGFVEASYFPKWVINLGHRQAGRLMTENIINIGIEENKMVDAVYALKDKLVPALQHPYGDSHAAEKMINQIKKYLKLSTQEV